MGVQYMVRLFSILLLCVYLCASDVIVLTKLLLNQYGVKYQEDKWRYLRGNMTLTKFNAIQIRDNVITVAGLQRLYKENFTNIKQFKIVKTTLNPNTMKFLMTNNKTFEFQSLNFFDCNILDQDLSYIVQRQAKTKNLEFRFNRISREGFRHLTRLKMNLTGLSLVSNSLLHDQSVNSIISFGLSQLKNLSLSQTSISGNNLIKVFKSTNTDKLIQLDISFNQFSTQFYRQFSKLSFQSLKRLNLGYLNIDEQVFSILKTMHFPKLQVIQLAGNQLSNSQGKQLITKKVFPKLNSINLDKNFITSKFFIHLREEGFIFQQMSCSIKKMDKKGLLQISQLNTSKLKSFTYQALSRPTPETILKFLNQTDFTKLQYLNLANIKQRNFFNDMVKIKWPKLKYLSFDYVSYINQSIYSGKIVFPELKFIGLQVIPYSVPDQISIVNFVKNIQKIAPKLQQITIQTQFIPQLIGAILNGNITNSITTRLQLKITSAIPIMNVFEIELHPSNQAKILRLHLPCVFAGYLGQLIFRYMELIMSQNGMIEISKILQQEDVSIQDFLIIQNHIKKFQNNLHRNFDFSELIQLHETTQLNFIRKIMAKSPSRYVFEQLQSFQLQLQQNTQVQLLQFIQFPKLHIFMISSLHYIEDQQTEYMFKYLERKFTQIDQIGVNLFISKPLLLNFFKNGQFQNLRYLQLHKTNALQAENFIQLQSYIKFQRLEIFKGLQQAFINNNLKFLGQSGMRPRNLQIRDILFNPGVLVQLCPLNFQFIIAFQIQVCGLNDEDLLQLINCIRQKHPNEQNIFFPKVKTLNLYKNYLSSNALSKWMQLGLPIMTSINIDQNMDGEKFNSVFLSPYSRRLQSFTLDSSKINGIDPSIDVRNFRKLQTFTIQNIKLFDADIKLLADFQFFSILSMGIGVKKIENCQFLKYLNKLTDNVLEIIIIIEDSPLITSECLKDFEEPTYQILTQILVIVGNSYYGQMSNFVSLILNKTGELRDIKLIQAYTNQDKKISKLIDKLSLNSITQIVFISCSLEDDAVRQIFTKNLEQITTISLQKNNFTGEGLSTFQNKNLKQLESLDFSHTKIDDKGIQYMIKNQFPNLKHLYLQSSGITGKGIQLLNNLKARILTSLDISNNDLKTQDILKLNPKKFPMLRTLIIYPQLTQKQYNRLLEHFQQTDRQSHLLSFQIKTDVVDLIEQEQQYQGYYNSTQQEGQDQQLVS